LTAIQVTIDLEHRENPTVELKVSVEHSESLVSTDQTGDLMASLDGALQKIEQQIRRQKDKRTERRRMPIKHLEVPVESEPEGE
jgi:putative sigma-54 modulation protein